MLSLFGVTVLVYFMKILIVLPEINYLKLNFIFDGTYIREKTIIFKFCQDTSGCETRRIRFLEVMCIAFVLFNQIRHTTYIAIQSHIVYIYFIIYSNSLSLVYNLEV